MITKEDCRQLYNYYAQVETTEKLIEDLEKFARSQDEKIPDVIPEKLFFTWEQRTLCSDLQGRAIPNRFCKGL